MKTEVWQTKKRGARSLEMRWRKYEAQVRTKGG